MSKPRILVLTAVGRTGMPIALQLLDEGFPVTAFVHKAELSKNWKPSSP